MRVDRVLDDAAWRDAVPIPLPYETHPGENTPTGHEASFLTLECDPVRDFACIRRINLRVKQGHVIALPADSAEGAP